MNTPWVVLSLIVGVAAYAHWPGRKPNRISPVTGIRVLKSERRLILMSGDRPIKAYRVTLGGRPVGAKRREGDLRTPEGRYIISGRNPRSRFHLSLRISYPNRKDLDLAAEAGVNPGGDIMIHGIRNGWGWIGRLHRFRDWTAGCIAVTNREIEEIWEVVPDGTPIEITP